MKLISLTISFLMMTFPLHGEWASAIHGEPSPAFLAADSSGNRILVSMHDRAGIWITDNGGLNWTQVNDRISNNPVIQAVPYCDIVSTGITADTMVVNLYHGDGSSMISQQFHTLNGGETWSSFQSIINDFWPDSINNVIFWDPAIILSDRIYYSREDGFCISYDGGETWSVIDVGPLHRGLNGALFDQHDPDTIFMYGTWGEEYSGGPPVGGVIGSYDGGLTWSRLTHMEDLVNETDGSITDLSRGDGQNLYACTAWIPGNYSYSPVLHSPDLGVTWSWIEPEGLPTRIATKHLLAVPEQPGRLLIAGQYEAGVWESNDGGHSWHRLLRGLPERPASVRNLYRNPYSGHLYICFLGQGIWRSIDFGETWHHIPSPPIGSTADSWYNLGLIVGEGGVLHGYERPPVFFAEDEAIQFQSVPVLDSDQDHVLKVRPVHYSTDMPILSYRTWNLWTLEREQKTVYSTDDGVTWEEVPNGFSGNSVVTAIESDTGLVLIGSNGTSIDLSYDLGHSWENHSTGFFFNFALMTVGNDLYTINTSGPDDYVRSCDYGLSWELLEFPDSEELYGPVSPVLALDDTLLFRGGTYCWALKPDGSWQQRGLINENISIIFFDWEIIPTENQSILVGGSKAHHQFMISRDHGWTWETQDVVLPGPFTGEVAVEIEYDQWRDRLWVNTNMGLAYMNNPTNVIDRDVWTFSPAKHCLLDTYPNPFNSTVMISYKLSKPGNIKLKVNDILGRQVEVLREGYAPLGENIIPFNASSYASGTYFITLYFDDQIIHRRVTLRK